MIYRLKNDEFDEVKNSLKDINIEDVKKELNYEDYTKIMGHKNVNETFTNKCDELKVLLGFTPDLYPVK
jgi:predicted transcriptional regulator